MAFKDPVQCLQLPGAGQHVARLPKCRRRERRELGWLARQVDLLGPRAGGGDLRAAVAARRGAQRRPRPGPSLPRGLWPLHRASGERAEREGVTGAQKGKSSGERGIRERGRGEEARFGEAPSRLEDTWNNSIKNWDIFLDPP